jgi:two-component system, chemotaxis family, protein-glutamate methylesterase/glutaminase
VKVKLAEQGEELLPGTVYFAPDKLHLTVKNSKGRLHSHLSPEPSDLLFCPSADILFGSMAAECGPRCIAVIMTGMGHDGVEGIRLIKQSGGKTVAQDRQSSVIYGMARVAVDAKLIDHVVPLPELAGEVYRMLSVEKQYHSEKEIFSS